MSPPQRRRRWFGGDPETDRLCRERFGELTAAAIAGDLESWARTDRGLVALVLLLDQFPRNIYRGTPRAFGGDPRALELARGLVGEGRHRRLPTIHQVFCFLPLEHSEALADQDRCVALLRQLSAATGVPQVGDFLRYAIAHRDVIARFGRFPHRNAMLGRQSSAEESAYLETHGGF